MMSNACNMARAICPQVKSAPGLRDVQALLISTADSQIQIDERTDEIEIRSPWGKNSLFRLSGRRSLAPLGIDPTMITDNP
jgi:hypothetical protein